MLNRSPLFWRKDTPPRGAHGYVLKFGKRAAKTYRRIAGRRIKISCETVSRIPNGSG